MTPNPLDPIIRKALNSARTIALVGASDRPERPSHEIGVYLQRAGYRIIPVNPKLLGETILGETTVGSLLDIQEPIDIIDVFRRSAFVLELIAEALKLPKPLIWLQLGVMHDAAAALARSAGHTVVQNRCIKVEHLRLCRQPTAV